LFSNDGDTFENADIPEEDSEEEDDDSVDVIEERVDEGPVVVNT